MRKLFLLVMILAPLTAKSQDLVIMRNGEKVNCKITKVDSLNVYYKTYCIVW